MKVSTNSAALLLSILVALPLMSFGPFKSFLEKSPPVEFNMLPPNGKCPPYIQEKLHDLDRISVHPKSRVLKTNLLVRVKERCIPVWGGLNSNSGTEWVMENMTLQTYGYQRNPYKPINPDDPNDPNITWSAPGPLFYLEKATSPFTNNGSQFKMVLYNRLPLNTENPGQCNSWENPRLSFPNCFHGDQSTNFHFHGFHVSPQPHQDDVGIRIDPEGTPSTGDPNQAIGQYRFDLDALNWRQAEGTHWYHAHKHGATSIQVLNGLVGMFVIQGPFDRWLNRTFWPHKLKEKKIVIQQIRELLWPDQRTKPRVRFTLANGQANPIIKMKPGEVQRWRFLNATMQAAGQVKLTFQGLEAKQIAMDGIRFAPKNYRRQPLLNVDSFDIHPGNRADFLVKAPRRSGRYYVTVEVIGEVDAARMRDIENRDQQIIASIPNYPYNQPPLLSIDVTGYPKTMKFPRSLTPLPKYLTDIPPPTKHRTVLYSQIGTPPTNQHLIDGVKFDPSCANQTTVLNTTEQWRVENNSTVEHPFHIHTNPFQVVEYRGIKFSPPFVWQDTLALPAGTRQNHGATVINQRFLDFTGGFVQHCHILGHEDRGMMLGVQTVCPNRQYGEPTPGRNSECRTGNYIPALPTCDGS